MTVNKCEVDIIDKFLEKIKVIVVKNLVDCLLIEKFDLNYKTDQGDSTNPRYPT